MEWLDSLELEQDEVNSLILFGLDAALPLSERQFSRAGYFEERGEGFDVNIIARALWHIMKERDVWEDIDEEIRAIKDID